MANEIANRSHAGGILETFQDPVQNPPRLLASWGLDESTLRRRSELDPGVYSVEMTQSTSGIVDPADAGRFISLDALVLTNVIVNLPATVVLISLLPDVDANPVAGEGIQIPLVWFELNDDVDPPNRVDARATIYFEVRSVPQQD